MTRRQFSYALIDFLQSDGVAYTTWIDTDKFVNKYNWVVDTISQTIDKNNRNFQSLHDELEWKYNFMIWKNNVSLNLNMSDIFT